MSDDTVQTNPAMLNRKARRAREQRASKLFHKALSQGAIVETGLKTVVNGAPFAFRFKTAVSILLGVWK